MSAYYWDAIGDSLSRSFAGCYDGGGYTISGLYTRSGDYQGLFGYVQIVSKYGNKYNCQYIENINIVNSEINGGEYVGGIIGHTYFSGGNNSEDIYIKNCSVEANIFGERYVGGIIGGATHNKSNATFRGSIEIESCSSKGDTISATYSYAGGIVGYTDIHSLEVIKSFNLSNITADSSSAGIVAYLKAISVGRISYCYNLGSITAINGTASGIIHNIFLSNGTPSVSCCFNMGNVK